MNNPDPIHDPIYLTTKAAAARLSLSPRTLEAWRLQDPSPGPDFFSIGRKAIRYRLADIDIWLEGKINLRRPRSKKKNQALPGQLPLLDPVENKKPKAPDYEDVAPGIRFEFDHGGRWLLWRKAKSFTGWEVLPANPDHWPHGVLKRIPPDRWPVGSH